MKPILFSTSMVQAILAGNKSQTRRIVKFPTEWDGKTVYPNGNLGLKYGVIDDVGNQLLHRLFPKYEVGDVLWVKEMYYAYGMWLRNGHSKTGKQKWKFFDTTLTGYKYHYCDNPPDNILPNSKRETYGWFKRSSLFMPYKAARLFLEITDIRVERLQDISEQDAISEGYSHSDWHRMNEDAAGIGLHSVPTKPILWYRELWESINGKGSWKKNEWVWVIEFKRIEKPINS